MGFDLRTGIAKQLGLAAAGLLLFAAPAYAACSTTDLTPTLTSTGDPAVAGDQAYTVVAPASGLSFEDDPVSAGDSVAITNGVTIDSTGTGAPGISVSGEFDTVCYDGLALGFIHADDDGLSVQQSSDGDVLLYVAHAITSGGAGIRVQHVADGLVEIAAGPIDSGWDGGIAVIRSGGGDTRITANGDIETPGIGILAAIAPFSSGDVDIATNADITANEGGIAVAHYGDEGDISITTAPGTTIVAQGSLGATGTGINVERSGGLDSDITITNGADIDADAAGIYLELCDCSTADVLIDSTGAIGVDTGEGIYIGKGAAGDTTVRQSGKVTVADGSGILIEQDDSGDVLVETGGDIGATDDGIRVEHWGRTGTVTINTSAGTTITADAGIGALREFAGLGSGSGGIVISNSADIVSDEAGIGASLCGCTGGDISITSTGSIDAAGSLGGSFGIVASHDGDGTVMVNAPGKITVGGFSSTGILVGKGGGGAVDITSGDIMADIGILVLSTDDTDLTITANGDIVAPQGIAATTGGAATLNVAGTITGEIGIELLADTITATIAPGAEITVDGPCGCSHGALLDSTMSSLTVGGTIDATGADAVLFDGGDATLTLLPGFVIHGQVDALDAATNRFILGGDSGEGSFDLDRLGADFTGFDTFLKTGNSAWTLSGTAFSGLLTANAGTVVVNDDIPGLDLSLTGTTLKGNAGLRSLTTTGGAIAPGNSIGIVTTAGDVTIGPGTVYTVEVDAAGASDRIVAGGAATLDPTASVTAIMEPGTYGAVTTYTILSAAGGVTGAFDDDVTLASAFFDAALSADLDNVYLTLTRNALTAGDFATTPNQAAAAAVLDAAGATAPYFDDLNVLAAAAVPGALDALSGDGYASLTAATLDDGRFVRDAALARRGARGIWTTPYGGLGHLPGDGNGPAIDHATGGLLLGADGEVGDGWLGVLLGYGQSRFDIPDRDMSATSGEFSLGAYGGTQWDAFYASFGAALTARDIDATRRVSFAGVDDSFTAAYASMTTQAFTELGYRLDIGGTSVTPFGGLAALQSATAGYTESGTGAGALTVDPGTAAALVATLGLRLEHEIALAGDRTLSLRAAAAWRHAMGSAATTNTMAASGSFAVAGAPLPADALAVSAGAELGMGPLRVALDYTGSLGSGGLSNAATATLAGTF